MPHLDRYHRQMLLPQIGGDGQRRLRDAHALVVGCGALGSIIIDLLARAGVGRLTIVDRDLVELTNLSRQLLYDERDVEQGMPKAEAARARVAAINRDVVVHAHVDDFTARNAEHFAAGVDLILDGLDNFQTRYLLNDLAVKHRLPFLYGGAVGTTGMSMPILPHSPSPPGRRSAVAERGVKPALRSATQAREAEGEGAPESRGGSRITWTESEATPCLRCVFPEAPPPGTTPTCDTAGVLATAVAMIAAHQVTGAIKLITGRIDSLERRLISIDVWSNTIHAFDVNTARTGGECPCCVQGHFEYLDGKTGDGGRVGTGGGGATTSLCGRNAIQVTPTPGRTAEPLDLASLAGRLAPHGRFVANRFLLRGVFDHVRAPGGRTGGEDVRSAGGGGGAGGGAGGGPGTGGGGEQIELTLFPDGRAIIKGTNEPGVARSIYDKFVGS